MGQKQDILFTKIFPENWDSKAPSIGTTDTKYGKKMSEWAEGVEILWGFTKSFFKQMIKVSAFYLEKQKSFIPKKNVF